MMEGNGPRVEVPSGFALRPLSDVMYRLDFTDTGCRIFDEHDRIVFAGSPRECENWLDFLENQAAQSTQPASSTPERALLLRLRQWLAQPSTSVNGAPCEWPDPRA